jgi:plastocyanin
MHLMKPLVWLAVLILLLLGVLMIAGTQVIYPRGSGMPFYQQLFVSGTNTPPLQPESSINNTVEVRNKYPFDVLVSYTNDGFEPAELAIRSGGTVRFTNNSEQYLWVAADGTFGSVYPAIQNGCGSSALDSCYALRPGEYWQFSFGAQGTWVLHNNLNKNKVTVVHVTK